MPEIWGTLGRAKQWVASKFDTLKAAKQFFELAGSVLSLAGVALAIVEYFFHIPIFYNPSKELSARFNEHVIPLVVLADQDNKSINDAVENNDAKGFAQAVQAFTSEKNLHGQIITAVETSEALIKCHKSYFCLVDGYHTYEQPMRRFWYTYRSVLIPMRGHLIPTSFGVNLESEAKRILKSTKRANIYLDVSSGSFRTPVPRGSPRVSSWKADAAVRVQLLLGHYLASATKAI